MMIAMLIALTACERGTEPMSVADLVGDHELLLVDGFSLPIDVWEGGALTLRGDSTFTMLINDEVWDAGTWTTEGNLLFVTGTRAFGTPWRAYILDHAIFFPKDFQHNYNDYLFAE